MTLARPALTLMGWLRLYDSLGLCIIPLQPKSKIPAVQWEAYQMERPSWAQVEKWFADGTPNVAVICGRISGGLVILDFEDEAGFRQFFGDRAAEDRTLVVKTPHGGFHTYFRETGDVPRRSIRISEDPPLDLLGEGGYAAAPPSVIDHAGCKSCGIRGVTGYEAISPSLEIAELQGVYASTVNRCRELGWSTRQVDRDTDMREVSKGVKEGHRNDSAFRYARHLLYFVGLDEETAWHELQRWNATNSPPLDERELRAVFESAKGYPKRAAYGVCDACHVRFDTKKEADEHFREKHIIREGALW